MADPRRLVALVAGALALVVPAGLLAAVPPGVAAAAPVREPYVPGQAYTGAFADPTVVRWGGRYYAHATTAAALSMPVLTSTDLRTWTAPASPDPAQRWAHDALPTPARWARTSTRADGSTFVGSWAPSIQYVAPGRWVAAYAVPRADTGRRCISVATGPSPLGPFTDTTTAPLTCGLRGTAIDPQVLRDGGRLYLLVKSKGGAGVPDSLVVRQLTGSATGFATGTRWRTLLSARGGWEGGVAENPAVVRTRRGVYLFWSANAFDTARYATGYARCRTVLGPCRRKGRLLPNNASLAGAGGATPFTDGAGRLRLAYHAYRTAELPYLASSGCAAAVASCPARRLYVATLAPARRGRLVVTASR